MKIIEYFVELFKTQSILTDYFAYKCLKKEPLESDVTYVAIPWAVLINKRMYGKLPSVRFNSPPFTVCQHDDYHKIIPFLKKMGIDTLFTPNKDAAYDGIKIISFPHCAVNKIRPSSQKDIFYSFIGLDSASVKGYAVRRKIFDMKHPANTIIKERKYWHWGRKSFGQKLSPVQQIGECMEYKNVLARSRFSLCPRGYGSNSVRFWESLQAGAIPVLLSDNLVLPEGIEWDKTIIRISEAEVETIPKVLKNITKEQEETMRKNCLKAYKQFSGENFVSPIRRHYDKRIKLYSFYTPSHKKMLDKYFLPSLKDDYEVILEKYDQRCSSGKFMSDGWVDTIFSNPVIIGLL